LRERKREIHYFVHVFLEAIWKRIKEKEKIDEWRRRRRGVKAKRERESEDEKIGGGGCLSFANWELLFI
jgi:hypothetical protein